MKKVLISILVLLTGFLLMTNVKAEDDKTLVVELPSNEMNFRVFLFELSIREVLALSFSIGTNEGYIQNNEGNNIIIGNINNNSVHFELAEGVKEEECIIDINSTEQALDMLEMLSMEDIFDGYSKIQFVLKEMKETFDDRIIIDLSHKDVYENSSSILFIIESMIPDSFNKGSELLTYNNIQNKELFTIYSDINYYTDSNNRPLDDIVSIKVDILKEVTEEDDIIIELTNQMITELNRYPDINISGYSKIIIKLSDKEYSGTDNYVLDVKNINKNNYVESTRILSYFTSKSNSILKESRMIYINNNENKKLFYIDATFLNDIMVKTGAMDDVTYEDNVITNLSDNSIEVIKELLGNINVGNLKSVVLKLADPVFLEGKEQTYNLKDKDKMSFRLDIPYEKFLKYGKVYIDDKLVGAKNYKVTEGSTIITLNKDYVTSLKKGEHNIRVEMIDGEVSTTFNIVDRVEIIEPIVEAVNKIIVENPETGDKIIICSILLVLSLVGVIVFRKKRRV